MKKLSQKEIKAIIKLERAFLNLPKTLKIYVVDASVVVCKIGVSSDEICEEVGYANPTVMLTDLHDDMDYGRQ